MNAPAVEVLADLSGDVHVLFGLAGGAVDEDVDGGDDLALRKLPDVKLVEVEDAVDAHDGLTNGFERNGGGNTLKKDVRGGLDEGEGRVEDDDGDQERDGWIRVESPPCGRVHDEKTGGNDTDVT